MDILIIEAVEPESEGFELVEGLGEEASESESPELSIEELEEIFGN